MIVIMCRVLRTSGVEFIQEKHQADQPLFTENNPSPAFLHPIFKAVPTGL